MFVRKSEDLCKTIMDKVNYASHVEGLMYVEGIGEKRIEEQLYLPMSESYQRLKEEIGSFNYMNEYQVRNIGWWLVVLVLVMVLMATSDPVISTQAAEASSPALLSEWLLTLMPPPLPLSSTEELEIFR